MNDSTTDGDITDSQVRMRIITRLKDTGDVEKVTYRESGTEDLSDDLTQGINRPVPTLHITLNSGNITNAVMRVLTDEGLSITPLTPTQFLADAATPGTIWNMSPEFWALFVRRHHNLTTASATDLHQMAQAIVNDDEEYPDTDTIEAAFEEIDSITSILSIFTDKLTADQYEALNQLADTIDIESIRENADDHFGLEFTTPGTHGASLDIRKGDDLDNGVEKRLTAEPK